VRRILASLVLAVVGVPLVAINYGNAAVTGGNYSLSRYDFAHEVNAISTNSAMACYVTNLWGVTFASGAGTNTIDETTITAWANLRLEGLAEITYAEDTFGLVYTSDVLSNAATNLEAQMSAAASANGAACGSLATPLNALASLPTSVAASLLQAEAASELMASKLPSRIAETDVSLRAFYEAHLGEYQNICASVALVRPSDVARFTADQAAGLTVAALAAKYSQDPSATSGGAYGCFDPSSNARDLVRGVALNTFGTPQTVTVEGATYSLYVAATSTTQLSFEAVATQVLKDVRNVNAGSIEAAKQAIYERVGVSVNPLLGRLGAGERGVGIYAPASPATTNVPNEGIGLDATSALHF
jgi:hypothetical protein